MKSFKRNFGKPNTPSHVLICAFACLLISMVFFYGAADAQELTIGNYDLVTSERVGRTEFNFIYRARIINSGPAVTNVTALLSSTSPNTEVIDGLLNFDDVPAESTIRSENTFTIRQDRRFPFDLSALVWVIQSTLISTVVETSPSNGEGDVAVTRETIIRLQRPLADETVVDEDVLFAEFGGQRIASRIHISPNRQTLTLFYQDLLPASARVRVTLIGDTLLDDNGVAVDVDGDGKPGGITTIDFDTLSLTVLPGTAVCGRVFASELGGNEMNVPLVGVTITVDGMEDTLRAVTDDMGNFRLEPAPAGEFFVHIDGATSTREIPEGAYYPFVG